MTDTGAGALRRSTPEVTGWIGWIVFAAIMLMTVGIFQIIEGLVALFNDEYYLVGQSGLVIDLDYTAWGWVHLVIGALALLIGIGVLTGNTAAQISGIVLATISAIVNLAFVAAYPVWSIIIIAVDVIVIYAIAVHGREMRAT